MSSYHTDTAPSPNVLRRSEHRKHDASSAHSKHSVRSTTSSGSSYVSAKSTISGYDQTSSPGRRRRTKMAAVVATKNSHALTTQRNIQDYSSEAEDRQKKAGVVSKNRSDKSEKSKKLTRAKHEESDSSTERRGEASTRRKLARVKAVVSDSSESEMERTVSERLDKAAQGSVNAQQVHTSEKSNKEYHKTKDSKKDKGSKAHKKHQLRKSDSVSDDSGSSTDLERAVSEILEESTLTVGASKSIANKNKAESKKKTKSRSNTQRNTKKDKTQIQESDNTDDAISEIERNTSELKVELDVEQSRYQDSASQSLSNESRLTARPVLTTQKISSKLDKQKQSKSNSDKKKSLQRSPSSSSSSSSSDSDVQSNTDYSTSKPLSQSDKNSKCQNEKHKSKTITGKDTNCKSKTEKLPKSKASKSDNGTSSDSDSNEHCDDSSTSQSAVPQNSQPNSKERKAQSTVTSELNKNPSVNLQSSPVASRAAGVSERGSGEGVQGAGGHSSSSPPPRGDQAMPKPVSKVHNRNDGLSFLDQDQEIFKLSQEIAQRQKQKHPPPAPSRVSEPAAAREGRPRAAASDKAPAAHTDHKLIAEQLEKRYHRNMKSLLKQHPVEEEESESEVDDDVVNEILNGSFGNKMDKFLTDIK
jgi:hypothetical protein